MIEVDVQLPLARFALQIHCATDARVTALVGPSGSGKTSLVETIAGLRPRANGRIVIDGVDVSTLPPERRGIGYVPQDVALFPHLSVRGNITFASKQRTRFDQLVETLALAPLLDRKPASLSGGERQRVALARALMMRPRLLLLDEPLASIDQPLREKILVYLRRIRALGVPMIYVTHQPFEALALATHCIVLREGRVTAQGPPAEVLYEYATEVDNVFEVSSPEDEPEKGITTVSTADGLRLVLPYDMVAQADFPLVVRISGEEIMLFGEKPSSISSRNVLEGRITAMREREGVVDLTVATPAPVHVRITRAAADDLALECVGSGPGSLRSTVWLAMRSRAFRVVG